MNNYVYGLFLSFYEKLNVEEKLAFDSKIQEMITCSKKNQIQEIGVMEHIMIDAFMRKIKGMVEPVSEELLLSLMDNIS